MQAVKSKVEYIIDVRSRVCRWLNFAVVSNVILSFRLYRVNFDIYADFTYIGIEIMQEQNSFKICIAFTLLEEKTIFLSIKGR